MCTRPGFGLLVAYLTITLHSIALITFIAVLANKGFINAFVDEEVAKDNSLDGQKLKTAIRATLSIFIALCLIVITATSVLARGINTRRHKLMVPWLIICVIGIICVLVYNFLIVFKLKKAGGKFGVGVCITLIQCLIFYPIYSLYRDVRTENKIIERTGRSV